jgi:hypothetical protein
MTPRTNGWLITPTRAETTRRGTHGMGLSGAGLEGSADWEEIFGECKATVDSPHEPPTVPDLRIDTTGTVPEDAVECVLGELRRRHMLESC